jgi:hybrid cluster-associated redox disulfide protein
MVTKDTTLEEVLKQPGAEKILAKYSLPCLNCPMAKLEMGILKIGEAAKIYGIDGDRLIKELNENKNKNKNQRV